VTAEITRFVGIDLGGARGKTTAVAEISATADGQVLVQSASTRDRGGPWHDDALWHLAERLHPGTVVAVNAPLTAPACVRCERPVCPGTAACPEPAVAWLRGPAEQFDPAKVRAGALRFPPYLHRATEVYLREARGMQLLTLTAAASSQVAARAAQLRRRLAGRGFVLDDNLIEVSPVAALTTWFGLRRARSYKHDADPWPTRAAIVEALTDVRFAPGSRFAREEVLRSVHVFDALMAAYVAHRRAREGWQLPVDACAGDGWIWSPPEPPDAA
jgi:predicted nuclease with RNAse H fold